MLLDFDVLKMTLSPSVSLFFIIILLQRFTADSYVEAFNPCSVARMAFNFVKYKRADCENCDKYFHCQVNYEAVHHCRGPLKEVTAAMISDAREWNSKDPNDSVEDQKANLFGRMGGNCADEYLIPRNCAYNPTTGKCGKRLDV